MPTLLRPPLSLTDLAGEPRTAGEENDPALRDARFGSLWVGTVQRRPPGWLPGSSCARYVPQGLSDFLILTLNIFRKARLRERAAEISQAAQDARF